MKKKLLVVNQLQFGYHIDYLFLARYLKNEYKITFLCWEYKEYTAKIEENGVEVIYISREGNIVKRNIRFIRSVFRQIAADSWYCIFLHYFKACSCIPVYFNKRFNIHLDIRTGSITDKTVYRLLNNLLLRWEASFFKSISIISEGLREKLKIDRKALILPLGASRIVVERQSRHKITLMYVGTFYKRRLEDTIEGLSIFLKRNPSADIVYIIIGSGWGNDTENLKHAISKYKLWDYVEFKGYIPHDELISYFKLSNVGLSYIPVTPWYDFQPATKTYEYLLAGMPVIATNTYENRQVINEDNGVLIDDNPDSFASGLGKIYDSIDCFDENIIRNSVQDHEWENIMLKLKHYLNTFPNMTEYEN